MKYLAVVALLAFLGAGCASQKQSLKAPSDAPTPNVELEATGLQRIEQVSMTKDTFLPQNLTVKIGTKVIFTNNASEPLWPASAPHPAHTDLPDFDPKRGIPAGETWEYTFQKIGTWKYHDHLYLGHYGSVTVTE